MSASIVNYCFVSPHYGGGVGEDTTHEFAVLIQSKCFIPFTGCCNQLPGNPIEFLTQMWEIGGMMQPSCYLIPI